MAVSFIVVTNVPPASAYQATTYHPGSPEFESLLEIMDAVDPDENHSLYHLPSNGLTFHVIYDLAGVADVGSAAPTPVHDVGAADVVQLVEVIAGMAQTTQKWDPNFTMKWLLFNRAAPGHHGRFVRVVNGRPVYAIRNTTDPNTPPLAPVDDDLEPTP